AIFFVLGVAACAACITALFLPALGLGGVVLALALLPLRSVLLGSTKAEKEADEFSLTRKLSELASKEELEAEFEAATAFVTPQKSNHHHSSDGIVELGEKHPEGPGLVKDHEIKREHLYTALRQLPGIAVYKSAPDVSFLFGDLPALVGYTTAEFVAMKDPFKTIMHPEDRVADEGVYDEWKAAGFPGVLKRRARFFKKDGTTTWLEDRMVAEADEEGGRASAIGVIVDVNKEVVAEEAERSALERQAFALKSGGFGIWEHDLVSGRLSQDDHAKRILGARGVADEALLDYWMSKTHPDDMALLRGAYEEIMRGEREAYESVSRVQFGQNNYRHIQVIGQVAERDSEGKPTRILGVLRDVSDRVAVERVMQEGQRLEALGVMAGSIAHDFNNFLGAVLGFASLAKEGIEPEHAVAQHIERVMRGAQRAKDLALQLQVYAGRGDFKMASLSVADVIEGITSLIQVSVSHRITLVVSKPAELPNILGDRTQIHQVLLNLVTNASDAIGEEYGKIEVGVEIAEADAHKRATWRIPSDSSSARFVCLSVRDNGCGMASDALAKVFEPFYTTKGSGHGLGLSAMLGIMKAHRGGVDIESRLGQGTTFRVYFPVSEEPVESEPSTMSDSGQGVSLNILAADDDPGIREFLADMAEAYGHKIELAENGEQAIRLYQSNPNGFDVAVFDVTMPIMDGVDAAIRIRDTSASLPIVLCSGFDDKGAIPKLNGHTGISFLQKPFTPSSLLAKINESISGPDA
ncbi:MAG: PAS domain-containing protein, partial [Planctomycetes bacterium]|nr:PAS domain-containing protein [Planctomycetota bacterium]